MMKSSITVAALSVATFFSNHALAAQAVSARSACSASDILDCANLDNAPLNLMGQQGLPTFQDGTQIFNSRRAQLEKDTVPFMDGQVPSPQQASAMMKQADDLRKYVQTFVAQNITSENQTPEQRLMISRLETVTFTIGDDNDNECYSAMPIGFPNGIYDPVRHTVILCPGLAKQPRAAIAQTLFHELSHVISPCKVALTYYSVNPSSDWLEGANQCVDYDEERGGTGNPQLDSLARYFREERVRAVVERPRGISETLRSCGIVSEQPNSSIPGDRQKFFGRAPQCIRDTYASQYRAATDQYVSLSGNPNPQAARDEYLALRPETCEVINDEHFADSLSARLTAQYAQANGWTRNDVRIAMMNDAMSACAAQDNQGYLDTSRYPAEQTRLSIAVSEPFIQERLGCGPQPNPQRLCLMPERFDTTRSSDPRQGQNEPRTTPRTSPQGTAR